MPTRCAQAKQVDNTTNILRLMLLLSLADRRGADAHLAQGKRPLAAVALPANGRKPVPEEEEREEKSKMTA